MVLLPLIASKVDVPIIAAGGMIDGASMAAALALGAEGIQMGTRMVCAAESPVHENWKQSIIEAAETDTVFLNQHTSPSLRALRTEKSGDYQFDTERNAMLELLNQDALYFGGDMEASLALCGQVAGRIDEVRPVAEIIDDCANGCTETLAVLADRYVGATRVASPTSAG